VRNVSKPLTAHFFIIFKWIGHGIEIIGQLAEVVRGRGFDTDGEIAIGPFPGSPGKSLNRF
jgi:hypothetical protein